MKFKLTLISTAVLATLASPMISQAKTTKATSTSNQQTTKTTTKNKKATTKKNKKAKSKTTSRPVDAYAKWYARHAANLDTQYTNDDQYNNGFTDGESHNMDTSEMNNQAYRYGWIIAAANSNSDYIDAPAANYYQWRTIYQSGVTFANNNNLTDSNLKYQNNTWNKTKSFGSSYSPDFDWEHWN